METNVTKLGSYKRVTSVRMNYGLGLSVKRGCKIATYFAAAESIPPQQIVVLVGMQIIAESSSLSVFCYLLLHPAGTGC